jgi:diguanylate cyclase (GGDEF)-like protein
MQTAPEKNIADILVVDDTPENLQMLSQGLRRFGYKVRAVKDGALALTVAHAAIPDLILLDINMPGMDGYETCEHLKASQVTRDIPVIFLSAMGEVDDKVKAFRVGGVDYVTKPFQILEVLARIETHLAISRLQQQLGQANQLLAERLEALSNAQAAEREQRILAETLLATIAAINSSLDFDEVLDHILENLGRVVPHSSASIALINESGMVQIQRAMGYRNNQPKEIFSRQSIPVDQLATWKKVATTGQPLIIEDPANDPLWLPLEGLEWVNAFACVPIIIHDKVVGFLNLESSQPGFFKAEHLERLNAFANQAAVAIEKSRLFEEAQRLASIDGLTGVFNRRHVLELAEQEFVQARRYGRYLSAIMLDLDRFKQVNDTYGHPTGDEALRILAFICQENLRSADILGRYGGEEFLILMPETGHEPALIAAERIRRQVEITALPTEKGPARVTISLGVATFEPGSDLSLNQLIKNADDALYAAKGNGRNQVGSYNLALKA